MLLMCHTLSTKLALAYGLRNLFLTSLWLEGARGGDGGASGGVNYTKILARRKYGLLLAT